MLAKTYKTTVIGGWMAGTGQSTKWVFRVWCIAEPAAMRKKKGFVKLGNVILSAAFITLCLAKCERRRSSEWTENWFSRRRFISDCWKCLTRHHLRSHKRFLPHSFFVTGVNYEAKIMKYALPACIIKRMRRRRVRTSPVNGVDEVLSMEFLEDWVLAFGFWIGGELGVNISWR